MVLFQRDRYGCGCISPSPAPSQNMNWDKALFCFECGFYFTLVRRRHHCRHCGHSFCGDCCSRRRFLHYTRLCDLCYSHYNHNLEENKWCQLFEEFKSTRHPILSYSTDIHNNMVNIYWKYLCDADTGIYHEIFVGMGEVYNFKVYNHQYYCLGHWNPYSDCPCDAV